MKIQKNIKWVAAIAAVCLAANTASAQDLIGINFVADDNTDSGEVSPGGVQNLFVDSLLTNETAGVFPQANWNNFGRYGDAITLNGSNGLSSGVIIAWNSAGMWHANGDAGFPGLINPNCKLMDGVLESTWTYTGPNTAIPPGTAVTNIAGNNTPIILLSGLQQFVAAQGGGTYSIVIYFKSTGTHSEFWIQTASGPSSAVVVGVTNPPQLYVDNPTPFDGTDFIQVPPTATNTAAAFAGNYMFFGGLTNDEILVRSQNIDVSPCSAISGIQIIAL